MPTPPETSTPIVVWVLTCAIVFLGVVCTVLLSIVWNRLKDRPEEVLASMREALGTLKQDIDALVAQVEALRADELKDLAAQISHLRSDVEGLKNHRRAVDKTLAEHARWLDGVATAAQENRDDIRDLERDVGRLKDEQGWTPLPRKAEKLKRRAVPRGRAPIGLGPPDDADEGGDGPAG